MADSSTRLLTPKDLRGVNKLLYAARAAWRKLGKILDPSGELLKYVQGCGDDECMRNILKGWLQRSDLNHSVQFLVDALVEVEEDWVASTVEQKYAKAQAVDTGDCEDLLDLSRTEDKPHKAARLNPREFQKGNEIGCGTGGVVFEGTWQNLPVAMKKLANVGPGNQQDLRREVSILSELRHPNVISYHGTVILDDGYYVVTELAEKGSLYSYLHKSDRDLSQSFRWAKEIAEGVRYLHQNGYIHRHLKSGNVLLKKDDSAKICDFGSAKQTNNHSTIQTKPTGTHQWRSPEAIRGDNVSFSWDAYSYGILLWELLTHELPFSHLKLCLPGQEYQLLQGILDGERPKPVPKGSNPKLKKLATLMQRCWKETPEERPTFTQIIADLEETPQVEDSQPQPSARTRSPQAEGATVDHLSVADLRDVLTALYPITYKWVELGLTLHILYDQLEAIKYKHWNESHICLQELMLKWLRQSPRATWSALIKALRLIGEERLAQDIELNYIPLGY